MTTTTETVYWPNYRVSSGTSGQVAIDASYVGPSLVSFDTAIHSFTGVDQPNWRYLIRSGVNATTAASGQRLQRFGIGPQYYCFGYVNSVIPAAVNARRRSEVPFNLALGFAQAGSQEEQRALEAARTEFAKKVDQVMTQFSGGTFLAELRETLHMIRNPAKKLRYGVGLYLDAIQKNGKRLKRQPFRAREKWLSDTWLEYSFGWAPLLNDLDDARQYLQRRQDVLAREVRTVKGVAGRNALRAEANQNWVAGNATVTCRERRVDNYVATLRGGVLCSALGRDLISQSALGLSARSFVPTLWEVIPWSFLIDYFTNIGDVITAWSNRNVDLAWGCQTLYRERKADFIDQRGTNSLVKVVEAKLIPSSQIMKSTYFSRSAFENSPVPSFNFELPGFGVKFINIAALAGARTRIGAMHLAQ